MLIGGAIIIGGRNQVNHGDIDQLFSGMLEVDGDSIANRRLDLTGTPVRPLRETHQVAGGESIGHGGIPSLD